MFFGLPYLPENLVSDAFNNILSEAPKHKKCTEFANYILENYIDTEQFSPTMWAEAWAPGFLIFMGCKSNTNYQKK